MHRVALLIGLLLYVSIPAESTLVVFQWTPNVILLAADSLNLKVLGRNKVGGVAACKIHQSGDFFLVIVGITNDPAVKIDLISIAADALERSRGGVRERASDLEAMLTPSVRKLWRYETKADPFTVKILTDNPDHRATITIIFASRRDHVAGYKTYAGLSNGSIKPEPMVLYGAESGMTQSQEYKAIGVAEEAMAASASDPKVGRLEGVPFISEFFQIQIRHEQERLAQHSYPRIGDPICILRIALGTAEWVPRHQGGCPQVR